MNKGEFIMDFCVILLAAKCSKERAIKIANSKWKWLTYFKARIDRIENILALDAIRVHTMNNTGPSFMTYRIYEMINNSHYE